jgi:L-serine dehydratase
MLSVLDIFKIGVGPSSSHTVGPMRIAARVMREAHGAGVLNRLNRLEVTLQGSLGATGIGHGSDRAVALGLMGADPETVDLDWAQMAMAALARTRILALANGRTIAFDPARDIVLRGDIVPTLHPNGVHITGWDSEGESVLDETWYSVGGGFVASAAQLAAPAPDDRIRVGPRVPLPFGSGAELLAHCADTGHDIAGVILANEDAMRPREATDAGLARIWTAMNGCIDRGLATGGILPGGLRVSRRAPGLWGKLQSAHGSNEREALFDWLNVYAMAVNEENAAGGRVVTAPTNGAAGIIPAVIRHYCADHGAQENRPVTATSPIGMFLLTAGGVGLLYKQRASISGAEMGCQGEVGVACSMAAAGLAAVWGATPQQVEHAAEIGMEHNLGLTCDPVGGLVQIPCIERNAIGAVKAVNAARLAIRAAEAPKVSLDQVIETMRQTGLDMSAKYKETSQGGLAVNVVEC